ncbi:hypothetical protein, partial [Salmonella sp. NW981]|uniref:hypothetical protein n=1 Tax=unclassified Salmonella TaxID=2614656 RepID=UPI003EC598AE
YSAGRAATTGRTGAVFNLQPPGCRGSYTGLNLLYRSQLASLIKTVVKAKSQPQAFSVDKFLRNRSIHADSCRK